MYVYCTYGRTLVNVTLLYIVLQYDCISVFGSTAAIVQSINLNLQHIYFFYTDDSRFCGRHGPKAQVNKPSAPSDLMCVAEAVMPRIILRLIQHLREHRYWHILSFHIICDAADAVSTCQCMPSHIEGRR
jgi:hypothetical protein